MTSYDTGTTLMTHGGAPKTISRHLRININYRLLRRRFRLVFLCMHLLLRMNVMLDLMCMDLVELRGARNKQNKILLVYSCIRNHACHSQSLQVRRLIHIYCCKWNISTQSYACKYVHL